MRRRNRYVLVGLAALSLPALASVFWGLPAQYQDVISREVTFWTSVYNSAPVDAISREVTFAAPNETPGSDGTFTDVVSREVTFRTIAGDPEDPRDGADGTQIDVISREVTFAAPSVVPGGDGQPVDVISREITFRALTPDLAIEALAIPAEGFAESAFNVSYRVTNVGDTATTESWTDRLTFSGVISGDMSGNHDASSFIPLAVGESYERILGPFTMPWDFTGEESVEFTLTVVADVNNQQHEHRDNQNGETDCEDGLCNNTLTQVVQVFPIDRPDLAVMIESVAPPTNGNGGYDSASDIGLQFKVANLGDAATNVLEWTDSVYLIEDDGSGQTPTDLIGAIHLASRPNLSYLQNGTGSEVGTFYLTALDVTLPQNIAGDYFLGVMTDSNGPGGQVLEDFEENNLVFSQLLQVDLQPQPDLVVEAIVDPTPGGSWWSSGEVVDVEWSVRNVGSGHVAGSITDRIQLVNDDDNSVTNLGTLDGNLNLLGLSAPVDRAASVMLPVNLPSTSYHLEIYTDWGQDLPELGPGGESNNLLASVPIDVHLSASPDFVPLYAELAGGTTVAQAGAPVNIEWKVSNIGAPGWNVQLSWSDTLYLVRAADLASFLPGNYTPLATFGESTVYGDVSSEDQWYIPESYVKTRSVILPQNTLPGDYGLVLVSDSGGSIFEFNSNHEAEDNNQTDPVAAVLFNIESHPADLSISASAQIDSVLHQPPTSGAPGGAMLLPWSVVNIAADAAGIAASGWTDRVYLSESPTALVNSRLLASRSNPAGLVPGDPALTHLAAAQVPFVAPGNYYLLFWCDKGHAVFDSDDSNNLVSTPFEVTGELSDLALGSVASSSSVEPGMPLTVSWSVANIGPAATSSSYWIDTVYLSSDEVPDPSSGDNIWIGSVARTSALEFGAAPYDVLRQFNLSHSIPGGDYWVIVKTDTSGAVFEIDESNNWAATRMFVTLDDAPLANLVVQGVVAQSSVTAGQDLALDYQLVNSGPGSTVTHGWTESFYLSLDHNLDAGDVYVGYASHASALAPGEVRDMSTSLEIPLAMSGTFVLLVETNSNGAVDEGGAIADNVNYDPGFVTVLPADPVELSVNLVELLDMDAVPITSALSGQRVRARWNTVNQSVTALESSTWVDGFFLSSDDTWSASDELIGFVRRPSTTIAALDHSELISGLDEDSVLVMPPVSDLSSYRVIVVSDILNQIPEGDEDDNEFPSAVPVSVASIPLGLDVVQGVELPNGEERWMKLEAAADQTIDITLSHPNHPGAWTEIYVRRGQLASTGNYHFSSVDPESNVQTVRIPRTTGADYYVLLRALEGVGTQNLEASVETEVREFAIEALSPEVAGLGVVTLVLEGSEMWRASEVALRPAGGSSNDDITAQEFHLDEVSGKILALFDLSGESVGDYDAVAYDGATEKLLAAAVSLEPASVLELGLDLEVTPSLRRGDDGHVDLTFRNRGNVNIPYSLATLGFRQAVAGGVDEDLIGIGSAQLGLEGFEIEGDDQGLVMLLEDLGPSQAHTVRFEFSVGTNWPVGEAAWAVSGMPWSEPVAGLSGFLAVASEEMRLAVLDATDTNEDLFLHASSSQTWSNAVEGSLSLSPDALHLPGSQVLTGGQLTQRIAEAAFEGTALGGAEGLAPGNEVPEHVVEELIQAGACAPFVGSDFDCSQLYPASCDNALDVASVAVAEGAADLGLALACVSIQDPDDPNGKSGPPGVGPRKYVAANADLEYRVYFENDASAGAWASLVRIEDQFDASLNGASVRLEQILIGRTLIELPPHTGSYFDRVQVGFDHGDSILVDISAGLDATTGTYLWSFQAIDPETGLPPTATDVGILPPSGHGQEGDSGGYVAFNVNPAPGATSGVGVRNRVKIQMDQAPPLETNEVENTLDADAPTSTLSEVNSPMPGLDTNIQLQWSATDVTETDEGSGVASYSLYYSPQAGGERIPVILNTTDLTGTFTGGVPGGEYWFYVEATDFVGNVESATQGLHVVLPSDCNANGVIDDDDISSGTSLDCNANGIPDECDVQDELFDCNENGIPDSCDLVGGTSADINGNGTPDECECLVTYYCTASPNSSGPGALISVSPGSSVSVGFNDLVLQVQGAAPGQPGLFYYGPNSISVPFGDGVRCVGGTTFRLGPPVVADSGGNVSRAMDYNAPPMSSVVGEVAAGSVWCFQYWYRDPAAGGAGFNLSDAVRIQFCD